MLWERRDSNLLGIWSDRYTAAIEDVDQDGVRDWLLLQPHALGYGPGYLGAVSGRDGATIWRIPIGRYHPCLYNPLCNKELRFTADIGHLGDWDRDGVADVMLVVEEIASINPSWISERKIWIFSGATGAELARERLPEDLEPWVAEPYGVPNKLHFLVGDLDHDGWMELAGPSWNASFGTGVSSYFTVLGRRTLFAPERTRLGQWVRFAVDLPGAAGMTFRVLLSTEFDGAGGGYRAGRFDTHLRPTQLMWATSAAPALQGTVGPQGRGEVDFHVPPLQALAGKTVYAAAVVPDPAVAGGFRTTSSLAQVDILP